MRLFLLSAAGRLVVHTVMRGGDRIPCIALFDVHTLLDIMDVHAPSLESGPSGRVPLWEAAHWVGSLSGKRSIGSGPSLESGPSGRVPLWEAAHRVGSPSGKQPIGSGPSLESGPSDRVKANNAL